MTEDTIHRIAKRPSDWDAADALREYDAEQYQRDAIAEAQSEEQRLRMRAATKRTDSTKDQA